MGTQRCWKYWNITDSVAQTNLFDINDASGLP